MDVLITTTVIVLALVGFVKLVTWLVSKPNPPKTKAEQFEDELPDERIEHLVALAEAFLEDDVITQPEAKLLAQWFKQNPASEFDERTEHIHYALGQFLSDGKLDAIEADELRTILSELCDSSEQRGGEFEPIVSIEIGDFGDKPRKGEVIQIQYESADGEQSQRLIEYQKTVHKGNITYLYARCQMRNAQRTFRADRVRELVRVETGELIEDPCAYLSSIS